MSRLPRYLVKANGGAFDIVIAADHKAAALMGAQKWPRSSRIRVYELGGEQIFVPKVEHKVTGVVAA